MYQVRLLTMAMLLWCVSGFNSVLAQTCELSVAA